MVYIYEISIFIYIFVLSSFLVSFMNLISYRIPKNISINISSRCDNCNFKINRLFLIPIFGYILSGGTCKNCNNKISVSHFIIELIGTIMFIVGYIYLGISLNYLIYCCLLSLLIICTLTDLYYMIVLDRILIIFLILSIIFIFVTNKYTNFYGGIFIFLILYFVNAFTYLITKKEGIGGGDIKLYGILGLYLGFSNVLFSFFLASLLATVFGKKLIKKDSGILPFVPFISISAVISMYYGESIISWYVNMFIVR